MARRLLLFFPPFLVFSAHAQWSTDPQLTNTPVCTANQYQWRPYVYPDGSGGAVFFWEDDRSGGSIYYNRLDSAGVTAWASAPSGVLLTVGYIYAYINHIIPDGSGGFYACWGDGTNLFVQRIGSNGTKLWGTDVLLSMTATKAFLCTDGNGGVIIAWADIRDDLTFARSQTYLQRLNATGNKLWAADGVRALNTASFDTPFGIVPDGNGGAVIALTDARNSNYDPVENEFDNIDIYAQRVNAAGIIQWAASGVAACTQTSNQVNNSDRRNAQVVADGSGGAVLAWIDYRNDPSNGRGGPGDIYAQRINGSGTAQWTSDGEVVCDAAEYQQEPALMADGTGGAVLAWSDDRNTRQVFTQRLNGAGTPLWAANGLPVGALRGDFRATPDETGANLLVAWADTAGWKIRVQKVSVSTGAKLWGAGNGVVVCDRDENQGEPVVTHDGAGGAIVGWYDQRNFSTSLIDIYANRVLGPRALPLNLLVFDGRLQNEDVKLYWRTGHEQNTSHFNVQRSTDGVAFQTIGALTAAGNSSEARDYAFTDANAASPGVRRLYYRLEQLDRDAKKQYSPTVSLLLSAKRFFSLSPVPAKEKLTVLLHSSLLSQGGYLRVVNTAGQTVITQKLGGATSQNINLTGLPGGMYWLSVSSGGKTFTEKFIKE